MDLLISAAGRPQRHIRDRNGLVKKSGQDERETPVLRILLRSGMTRRESERHIQRHA